MREIRPVDSLEDIREIHRRARNVLLRACRQLEAEDIAISCRNPLSQEDWEQLKRHVIVIIDVRSVCPNQQYGITIMWPDYLHAVRRLQYPRKIQHIIESLRQESYVSHDGQHNLVITEGYYMPAELALYP